MTTRSTCHPRSLVTGLFAAALALLPACGDSSDDAAAKPTFAYVGCADPTGKIFAFTVDPATGELTEKSVIETGGAVSFAAFHPSHKYLYVNHRMLDKVSAFSVDPTTGALTLLNQVDLMGAAGTMRAGPVHVHVDGSGKYLFVANFQGNIVLVHALGSDGKIGALTAMQTSGVNAHLVRTDPGNKFALVPYLGTDIIAQYRFDQATGALSPNDPPAVALDAGTGPRHLDFHPNGKWVYLVSEKAGTVIPFAFDGAKGTLAKKTAVTIVPDGFSHPMGPFGGHIEVAPSGRFLYATERRSAVVATLSIDQTSGEVTRIGSEATRGMTPRNFALTPDGGHLIVGNQDSKNLAIYAVDKGTGALTFRRTRDDLCELPFFVRTVTF